MVGETIRQARIDKHLTQKQLGELLGYKGRTGELMVQHWETGRREPPANKYRIIAEVLSLSLDQLVP